MEKRKDDRVRTTISVRVFGLDADGTPFSRSARTVDVSSSGVRLAGLDVRLNPGDIIGVQNGSEKARFRVVWVGNSMRNGDQMGLRCLQAESKIWGCAVVDSKQDPACSTEFKERRVHKRFDCDLGVELRKESTAPPMHVRCTDISRSGCYLETWSTFPVGTTLLLSFTLPGGRIQATGEVRISDANFGMGVQFQTMEGGLVLEQYISDAERATKELLASARQAVRVNAKTPPSETHSWECISETALETAEARRAPARILLADDSKFLRGAYSMYLKRAGFQVVTADDGEQALTLACEEQPDAIVLDLLMPKVGGVAALERLKQNAVTASIPVIILSGLPSSNEAKLRDAGAFSYAAKTEVGPEELPKLVRLALTQLCTLLPAEHRMGFHRADA